jgi:hypothetical protein
MGSHAHPGTRRQVTQEMKMDKWPHSKKNVSAKPLAHACNPSYSGGRDQKDHGLKPVLGK